MPPRSNGQGYHSRTPESLEKAEREKKLPAKWRLRTFLALLFFDSTCSAILLTPLVPRLKTAKDLSTDHFTLHGSLWDLLVLAIPRILSALLAILLAYHRTSPPKLSVELYHKNGYKKTKAELEEEALGAPILPKFRRFITRAAFACEFFAFLTGILLMLKCLMRLYVEIGILDDSEPRHPVFWITLSITALCSLIEASYIDSMEKVAYVCGRARRNELQEGGQFATFFERIGRNLTQPLLSSSENECEEDEEQNMRRSGNRIGDHVSSDIGGDADYKAQWSDLLGICSADIYLIVLASLFLILAAVANILVPHFTGKILDALVSHSSDNNPDQPSNGSLVHIPGFVSNIERLVLVSILGGILAGIRGSIFTIVEARVNVRLRIRLMDAVLSQDISFFEMTRTGDLTSRLSSDTTLVGSQVTTNVSVFLRSIVQAVGVLAFMFMISWQLSLLAFITIPFVSVLSKWYGKFVRRLSKLQQKKLAEGNSVSESAISAMATVRAFGAETSELDEFEKCMGDYLTINSRVAAATFGYSTCVGALPELVKALVLYYGGLLVQSHGPDHITGGQLVSFILYLSSLSNSFSSLGGIFASLTRAVGAADKVFELMHRKSRVKPPSHQDHDRLETMSRSTVFGVGASRTMEAKAHGLRPDNCRGEITLKHVEMRYPARPQHTVLKDLSLKIPSGAVVALVGASGSGKSSIVSLLQHLYEPSAGEVCIDGNEVHELNPDWLSRNVSVVSQEPTLFARSVRRNIIYGLEGTEYEPSQEEIEEAARLANANSFIERLPFGYETDIGERGVQLSGGQKQRVAIARALVRKPRVLLLDEGKIPLCHSMQYSSGSQDGTICSVRNYLTRIPLAVFKATSALDAESEAVVQEAIDGMISGQRSLDGDPARSMTVVVVAHRLSTVRNSDVIYVVEEGRIIEQGSHDELVASDAGAYGALIRRQINAQNKFERNESGL